MGLKNTHTFMRMHYMGQKTSGEKEGGRDQYIPMFSRSMKRSNQRPTNGSWPIFKSCLFPKHLMLCQIPDTITAGQEEGAVFGMGQDVLLRRIYEKRIIALFNPTPGFWDYQFCIVTHTCSTNICFHEFSMIYWSRSDFLVSISPL